MGRSTALISPAPTVTFVRTGSPAAHRLISGVISKKGRPVHGHSVQKCPDLRLPAACWKAELNDPRYEPLCIWPDRWRQGRLVISSQVGERYRQFDVPGRRPRPSFAPSHRASDVRHPVVTLISEAPVLLPEEPFPVAATAIVEGAVPSRTVLADRRDRRRGDSFGQRQLLEALHLPPRGTPPPPGRPAAPPDRLRRHSQHQRGHPPPVRGAFARVRPADARGARGTLRPSCRPGAETGRSADHCGLPRSAIPSNPPLPARLSQRVLAELERDRPAPSPWKARVQAPDRVPHVVNHSNVWIQRQPARRPLPRTPGPHSRSRHPPVRGRYGSGFGAFLEHQYQPAAQTEDTP